MAKNSFQIFKSDNKTFHWDINNILFVLILVFGFIKILNIGYISKIADKGLIGVIIVGIILLIANIFRKKPLNGKLQGTLTFNSDHIEIDDRKIEINKLKKIFLRIDDYEGYSHPQTRAALFPTISNGTNNLLELELKTGEKIKLFFQMEYENQVEELRPFMVTLVQNNIIEVEKGIKWLKMNDDILINRFRIDTNSKEL
ncbi:hypothetical protein [Flavobacterium sp.]|uniref:hypothetical protein n=1 Tax=Flavobacterium sp. TaxID=239 RepID=UPI00391A6B7A